MQLDIPEPGDTWTTTLFRLLKPIQNVTYPSSIGSQQSPSHSTTATTSSANINTFPKAYQHPPGILWRSFVAKCVYRDLLALEAHQSISNAQNYKKQPRRQRRFARMNEYGLGAIIFYEIPLKYLGELEAFPSPCTKEWTLEGVFGDGDPTSGTGMSVEELLEGIDARIVYVPLYACTSFVTGQIMNSFFHQLDANHEIMNPVSVPGGFGFGVDSKGFNLFDKGLGCHCPRSESSTEPSVNMEGVSNSNSKPASSPRSTEEVAWSPRGGMKSSIKVVDVENPDDQELLSVNEQPYDSPQSLQKLHATELVLVGNEITDTHNEQWELDWVDAQLRRDTHDLAKHQRNEENKILQQNADEEQDEESFVTALESFSSENILLISTLEDEKANQAQDTPIYSLDSMAVTVIAPDDSTTPTISAPQNSSYSYAVSLSSITNLPLVDSAMKVAALSQKHTESTLQMCSEMSSISNLHDYLTRPDCRSSSDSLDGDSPSFLPSSDSDSAISSVILQPINGSTDSNSPPKVSQMAKFEDGGLLIHSSPVPSVRPYALPSFQLSSSCLSGTSSTSRVQVGSLMDLTTALSSKESVRSPLLSTSEFRPSSQYRLKRSLSVSSLASTVGNAYTKGNKFGKISRKSEGYPSR